MKIYVASSWKNTMQDAIVILLRKAGFDVYDFKHPEGKSGFSWHEVDGDWKMWTREQYQLALRHPRAIDGFNEDFTAMKWADACVLVLPCGRSAHFEAGYFWGAGKPVHILLDPTFEPELMYKGATSISNSPMELLAALGIKD